jgi:hypothetical protein
VLAILTTSCKASRAEAPIPGPPPLHLLPLTDLTPAAGLVWLIEARPREIAENAALIPALAEVVPEARMQSFAERNGGVDVRAMDALVVAEYAETTLILTHQVFNPARVEAAFAHRAIHVDGRGLDQTSEDPRGSITRVWGSDANGRIELAMFGHESVGVEMGRFGPLRAAELFAQGKLKRAAPALRREPLLRAATLLGDGVVRAFAPGPFTDDWEKGLGGLLGASTAAALTVRAASAAPVSTPSSNVNQTSLPTLAFTFLLLGAWGDDAYRAGQRLLVEFDIVAATSIGRLVGMDHPTQGPTLHALPDALSVEFALDALTFAKGLHAATAARVDEIMAP